MWTVILLIGSNIFMTLVWHGHLKYKEVSLWKVILVSWASTSSSTAYRSPPTASPLAPSPRDELKVMQEVITLSVFGFFNFGDRLHWNHLAAFGCLIAGAFFTFHNF